MKNYNDLRGVNLEVPSSGRGEERKEVDFVAAKTAVGLNSNIRRAVGTEANQVVRQVRATTTKIGDEIIL